MSISQAICTAVALQTLYSSSVADIVSTAVVLQTLYSSSVADIVSTASTYSGEIGKDDKAVESWN
jgi:hypothetical protein